MDVVLFKRCYLGASVCPIEMSRLEMLLRQNRRQHQQRHESTNPPCRLHKSGCRVRLDSFARVRLRRRNQLGKFKEELRRNLLRRGIDHSRPQLTQFSAQPGVDIITQ